MAIIYVNSGAGGADDGTSWTDAFLTFGQAWTAWTSGDVVYMHSGHAESSATELLYGADVMGDTNPLVVYSVDKDNSDAYTPGTSAQLKVTGANVDIDFNDSFHAYGVWFEMVDGDFDINSFGHAFRFEDCNFKWTANTANRTFTIGPKPLLINCTLDNVTAASFGYSLTSTTGTGTFLGCTFKGKSSGSTFIELGSNYNEESLFVGCDFSGLTNVTNLNDTGTGIDMVGCRFASGDGLQAPTGGIQNRASAYATAVDGAGSAKNYISEHYFGVGTVNQDTALYRDDGWQDEDGDTRLAHKMSPSPNVKGPHTPFWGPDLRAYVSDTGSKTLTVYAVEDFTTALTDDEAWIDVFYLGTSNSVLNSLAGGRSVLSSTSLTTDTKAWTGASGKTKVKFSETVTINKAGTYLVRVYLGKYESSKALWYCPLVEVS